MFGCCRWICAPPLGLCWIVPESWVRTWVHTSPGVEEESDMFYESGLRRLSFVYLLPAGLQYWLLSFTGAFVRLPTHLYVSSILSWTIWRCCLLDFCCYAEVRCIESRCLQVVWDLLVLNYIILSLSFREEISFPYCVVWKFDSIWYNYSLWHIRNRTFVVSYILL